MHWMKYDCNKSLLELHSLLSSISISYIHFKNHKKSDLSRYKEDELDAHIEKLHEYNDIKDVGQMLLGRLGEFSFVC